MFSLILYKIGSDEIGRQLDNLSLAPDTPLSQVLPADDYLKLREYQASQSRISLFTSLFYMNLSYLAVGGIASYIMARRTLQPIEHSHEAQSRFTSDVSHELRTPLATIKTELEVALRDPKITKPEMRELLTSNLEEVNKLSQITKTLLALSRLEYSSLPFTRIALDDIVRRVTERLNKLNHRIAYSAPDKPMYISGNQTSMEELVTILIDNALKYSPSSSKVRVNLRKSSKKAKLEITNTGKGIKPEELPLIFDRFYRADQSRTGGDESGVGLGLPLAERVVELHKGDFSVSSEPGEKTTFTVQIPLDQSSTKSKRDRLKLQHLRH